MMSGTSSSQAKVTATRRETPSCIPFAPRLYARSARRSGARLTLGDQDAPPNAAVDPVVIAIPGAHRRLLRRGVPDRPRLRGNRRGRFPPLPVRCATGFGTHQGRRSCDSPRQRSGLAGRTRRDHERCRGVTRSHQLMVSPSVVIRSRR